MVMEIKVARVRIPMIMAADARRSPEALAGYRCGF